MTPDRDGSGDAVVVLAAGRGTRMGGPKALMTVAGLAWWRHQQARLAALAKDVPITRCLWVVTPDVLDAMAADSRALLDTVAVESGRPMFNSAQVGVRAALDGSATTAGVFILPVDVPAPSSAVWLALRSGATDRPVVPSFGGSRGHPIYLPAAWLQAEFVPLGNDPAAESRRLDEVIAPRRVLVPVSDPVVLINLNTPADVDGWLRSQRG